MSKSISRIPHLSITQTIEYNNVLSGKRVGIISGVVVAALTTNTEDQEYWTRMSPTCMDIIDAFGFYARYNADDFLSFYDYVESRDDDLFSDEIKSRIIPASRLILEDVLLFGLGKNIIGINHVAIQYGVVEYPILYEYCRNNGFVPRRELIVEEIIRMRNYSLLEHIPEFAAYCAAICVVKNMIMDLYICLTWTTYTREVFSIHALIWLTTTPDSCSDVRTYLELTERLVPNAYDDDAVTLVGTPISTIVDALLVYPNIMFLPYYTLARGKPLTPDEQIEILKRMEFQYAFGSKVNNYTNQIRGDKVYPRPIEIYTSFGERKRVKHTDRVTYLFRTFPLSEALVELFCDYDIPGLFELYCRWREEIFATHIVMIYRKNAKKCIETLYKLIREHMVFDTTDIARLIDDKIIEDSKFEGLIRHQILSF